MKQSTYSYLWLYPLILWFEILVNTDILILEFYGCIRNIGKILMDILTKILMELKLFKIRGNT